MTNKRNFDLVRVIGGFEVTQRTKDGMFNATELMKSWKQYTGQEKRITDFLDNDQTKEFIKTLAEDIVNQEVPNVALSRTLEDVEKQDIMKQVICTTKGRYGATWMHPLLFVKYAMWYNPKFELEVLKMVMDGLIEMRNTIADSYKDWTATLAKVGAKTQDDFSRCQKCINYAVFNKHHPDIRNNATTEQLNKMRDLEKQICQMVDFGYIKTLADVRGFLQKVWERDFPAPFTDPKD